MARQDDPRSDRRQRGWRTLEVVRLFPRQESRPSAARPDIERFAGLLAAFVDLGRERHDLYLRGSAAPPPLGFAVRLQPHPASAGGELFLWVDGGRLTTWSRAGEAPRAATRVRPVRLDLTVAFRWEGLVFTDAERLAYTLLRWMEDQVTGGGGARTPPSAGEAV